MSAQATAQRGARQHWATPGGSHDRLRALAQERAAGAGRRPRRLPADRAVHPRAAKSASCSTRRRSPCRGRAPEGDRGAVSRRGFARASPSRCAPARRVQQSSRDPVVQLNDLEARLQMPDGGPVVNARRGAYDMDKETVAMDGPIQVQSARRLSADDARRRYRPQPAPARAAAAPSMGACRSGTFRADSLSADLAEQHRDAGGQRPLAHRPELDAKGADGA